MSTVALSETKSSVAALCCQSSHHSGRLESQIMWRRSKRHSSPLPQSLDEAFQTLFSTCNAANPEYHSINCPDVTEELLRRQSQSHISGDKVNPLLLSVCASCREKKKASTS